jgi:hypothetical protein
MRRDSDLDQRVTRRSAADPGTALAFQADGVAILDAGRDFYVECAAIRTRREVPLAASKKPRVSE